MNLAIFRPPDPAQQIRRPAGRNPPFAVSGPGERLAVVGLERSDLESRTAEIWASAGERPALRDVAPTGAVAAAYDRHGQLVRIAHLRPGAAPAWEEPSAAPWLPHRLTVVWLYLDGVGVTHGVTARYPRPVTTACGRSGDGWSRSDRPTLDCPACSQALGDPASWILLRR